MARRKVIVGRRQTIRQGNATVPGFSNSVADGGPANAGAGYQKAFTTGASQVQRGANVSTTGVPIIGANTANAPSVTQARGTRTTPKTGTPPNVGSRTTPKTGNAPNTGTRTKPGRQATPNTGTRTRPR